MTVIGRDHLEAVSRETLHRYARLLANEWASKGFLPRELMPTWWLRDVEMLRREVERRGVQLTLF